MVSVNSWIEENCSGPARLHLGCGSKYLDGWCNVDNFPISPGELHRGNDIRPDVWADLLKLELEPNSIDEILAVHVFEHFYRHELKSLLVDLFLGLKPGGVLVVEMPDFRRIVLLSTFLVRRPRQSDANANRDLITSQFYGAAWEESQQSFPYHKYVWEKSEFASVLREIGYEICLLTNGTRYHQAGRDFACVARKPAKRITQQSRLEQEVLKEYGGALRRAHRQGRNISRLVLRGLGRRKNC